MFFEYFKMISIFLKLIKKYKETEFKINEKRCKYIKQKRNKIDLNYKLLILFY